MKRFSILTLVLTGVLLAGGCATKKYVRNTTTPIQAKVDQVGEQANRNANDIAETRKDLKSAEERAETGISSAKERAMTADSRAGEALNKAAEAGTAAAGAQSTADQAKAASEQNSGEIASLRTVVANIDDYRKAGETTVQFQFGRAELTKEAKEQLDQFVTSNPMPKRFVISVEGFTDKTGSADYNTELSQKRANAVVNFLVSKHDIPVYRIYMVGLGQNKLIDDGKTRDARTRSRRVEVKIFTADQSMTPGKTTTISATR